MSLNLADFLISEESSLQECLVKIESNAHGLVFLTNKSDQVVAVATDGDIRRQLIADGSLKNKISSCANYNFVRGEVGAPREELLKKLDHRIHTLPILDKLFHLVGVVSKTHLPIDSESTVYARSRAPVRVSFGGGGSDLTDYFSTGNVGAVINSTITLYCHATLRIRNDPRIVLRSLDLNKSIELDSLHSATDLHDEFRLIAALLKVVRPDFGFELFLNSDFPVNSGLGGSAVVCAAVLGCFNELRIDKWDSHELAEIAYQAERHTLGVSGGWQDQYATVFGGFNFMEFRMDQNIVHPLRIPNDTLLELEESLILCDTGISHNSGKIHQDQAAQRLFAEVREKVEANVRLSYEMRNHLLRGRLTEFGKCLDLAWQLKRQFSKMISSDHLDTIYQSARLNGALGGKLLGAGGGGFFLFYAPPFQQHRLIQHLQATGLKVQPFRFEQQGLQAWTVRESRNF